MQVGTVAAIYRYPVKSMRGEALRSAVVTKNGIPGDRGFVLFDPAQRKAASAKNVERFPGLLQFTARYLSEADGAQTLPTVKITFPDGREVRSDEDRCCELLSSWFGQATAISAVTDDESARPAAGKYSMAGTYFDYAPLHLLTDTALASLASQMPQSVIAVERFRPNLLIRHVAAEAFPENAWTDRELRLGEARVRVTDPCPRCAMPTLAQANLPRDTRILKMIARSNMIYTPVLGRKEPCLGTYAFVLEEGSVSVGDQVWLD
ncbi:MAG TPA: MOSC domain-containing protein [Steroidobacteraceae bacterium]